MPCDNWHVYWHGYQNGGFVGACIGVLIGMAVYWFLDPFIERDTPAAPETGKTEGGGTDG